MQDSGRQPSAKHRLLLRHRWALGDTVLMTGVVRDIHQAYPGRYEIMVDTHWTPIWWNNPWIVPLDPNARPTPQLIELSWGRAIRTDGYAEIDGQKQPRHILAWYHHSLQVQTGIRVPCTLPHGDLHLQENEQSPLVSGRYWVLLSGGKMDITNKHWWIERYQQVVYRLRDQGIQTVQCGATHEGNVHPPLDGVLNMVGKTDNVRDLFNIILHSDGVICPVTGPTHIAACFQRPCVVIAGGREGPWFEHYTDRYQAFGSECQPVTVPHRFLETMTRLPCCQKRGCWKRRTVPVQPEDLTTKANQLCRNPVRNEHQAVAGCMDLITVDQVVEAVLDYYKDGTLLPIQSESKNTFDSPPKIVIPTHPIKQILSYEDVRIVRSPSLPPKQQQPRQQVPPQEIHQAGPIRQDPRLQLLDNRIIGGKFTVCVLCWGPHPELAKRCLDGILGSLPRNRMDLRVATNEASPETLRYLKIIKPDKLYISPTNRFKYPVMRQMFHDPAAPIQTRYIVWFDDDAFVIDPRWAVRLTETIVTNHPRECRLYGIRCYHDLQHYRVNGYRPEQWFQRASWYQGVPWRIHGSQQRAPNGSCIDFVPGWFWAIATETVRTSDIPDERLRHNGGDITIGAQVIQAGKQIKQFNQDRSLVNVPPKASGGRRIGGYEESFLWVPPENQFQRTYTGG